MYKLNYEQRREAERILEHEFDDTDALAYELVALRLIAKCAIASVVNPMWNGICDEDVALEYALRELGLLQPEQVPTHKAQ